MATKSVYSWHYFDPNDVVDERTSLVLKPTNGCRWVIYEQLNEPAPGPNKWVYDGYATRREMRVALWELRRSEANASITTKMEVVKPVQPTVV